MLINSINKCIQQSFLTTSLKNISSKSWAALAILAFSSFVIGRKYSCFFARKAVALWNKNESSTTTKVNQVASSVSLDKKPFEIILDQWIKEDPARIPAQKIILEFSSTYSEETHLNLVSLELTSLPEIFHLEPFLSKLKQLNLSKNSLKCLPESFGNLLALTTLNLSENSLKSLPESFGNLHALTTLNLSENLLKCLPESFGNLHALTTLDLSENSLKSLPESFGNLEALTILDLTENSLTNLPKSFDNQQALITRLLTANGLTSLPEYFQEIIGIIYPTEALISLPKSFGNLHALTTLNLSKNSLTNLPESFGDLHALTTLDLSKNSLKSLPESFGNLQALTILKLNKNSLDSLPESFGNLRALTTLELLSNQLTSLLESFGNLQALTTLELEYNGSESLPESFCSLQALTTLKFLSCQLKNLPESFGNLQALTTVYFRCFSPRSLPESLGNLQALTTLEIDHNVWLESLPESFGNLQALTTLKLRGSLLTSLPESFGNLQALTTLEIASNCRLTSLPESFGNLHALTTLEFSFIDSLVSLPESFGNLQALTTLKLNSNHSLVSLPESFGNLQALTTLELSYNRILSGLPMQIIDLPPTCVIDLSRCNLSQTILERILEITTDLMYAGPHISFSISDRVHGAEKSIKESLKDLHSIADKSLINFSNLKKTSTLRSWLHRLSDIADYKKQGSLQKALANKIIEYLNQANESLGFREIFYNIIQDAAETCGDRMSLSVLHLGIAYKLAIIDLKDMKKLSDFLKSVWAIELLEEIARNKIPTLPFFDEIEVYLGYPIKLKETLNLPIDVQEMLYFPCSALKDKDLQEAKDLVLSKQGNQEAYFAFLIGHDKWKEALSFNYTEEYQAILNKKIDTSELENPDYSTIKEKYNQELIELTKKSLS